MSELDFDIVLLSFVQPNAKKSRKQSEILTLDVVAVGKSL